MRLHPFARSDVGRVRKGNEDNYFAGTAVFAVADGMGGHAGGEVAAEIALKPIEDLETREFATPDEADQALAEALRLANEQVVARADAEPDLSGMGTTLTAVLVRDGYLHVAHVGDSRAYLLRHDEAISQLTTDHTLVERLIREGRLSRDEAASHPQRNVVTRAIGQERRVVVDSLPPLRLQPGDQVLLCSDGLTGPIRDTDIADTLNRVADGDKAVTELIDAANAAGGPDNITVVLLRVSDAEAAPPPAADATEGESPRLIRTRTESGAGDWARTFGRLGAPQGVDKRPNASHSPARPSNTGGGSRRVVAAVLAALVLLAIVGGGGWFVLSRAYFVGAHTETEQVAVFRGLPQDVAGIPLHWVIDEEITDLPLDAFPEYRQEDLRRGITAGTLREARRIVTDLRASADTEDPEQPASSDQTDSEPTAAP